MNNEVYASPESELDDSDVAERKTKTDSYFSKLWRGDIKLWKTILVANVLLFVFVEALAVFGSMVFLDGTGSKSFGMLYALLINIIYGVFCTVSVWRASPSPKSSFKGAFSKLWVVVFAIYLVFVNYSLIVG